MVTVALPGHFELDTEVQEGGKNFSVGQRQLLTIARAVLRAPRVLIMDEATASVDHATDTIIQAKIRQIFAKSTVLTIAHRLDTILDSDRVLVMDSGRIAEYASPADLAADPDSLFASLLAAHQQQG